MHTTDATHAPPTQPVDSAHGQSPGFPPGTLEEARSLIGMDLRRQDHQWNTGAGADTVRHFCHGIGDSNPLFTDPAHGRASRWGAGLAPGCYQYTVDSTTVAPKLRRPNVFGDTSWCRGTVTGKRVEDGLHVVDIAVRVDSQRGETTADGTATVALPSRARPAR